MPENIPVVIIQGPTASGKSALAVDLAEKTGGAVINADSMQVYRGLRILTARPDVETESRVPHHLFAVIDPAQNFSVGHWLELATRHIKQAREKSVVPVLAGGTGLYLKCLRQGLVDLPPVDPAFVEKAEQLYADIGGDAFRQELLRHDAGALNINPRDRQRLIRAYSVFTASGRTLTDWQQEQSKGPVVDGPFFTVRIMPERQLLYRAIDRRFEKMIELGALDEVKNLLALKLDKNLPAMKALGVPELSAFINGQLSMQDAVTKACQKSRNYAKRQLTWLRHQTSGDVDLNRPYQGEDLGSILIQFMQFCLQNK